MLQTIKKSGGRLQLGLLAGLLAATAVAPTVVQAQPGHRGQGSNHRAPGTERVLRGEVGSVMGSNRFVLRRARRDVVVTLVGRRVPRFSTGNQVEVTGSFRDRAFFARRLHVVSER